MNSNKAKTTAMELKAILELYAPKCDEIKMALRKNEALIEQAMAGEDINYHLCTVYIGFIRPLQENWDLSESEYKRVISAVAAFDEALKESYEQKQRHA
jgi:hypothetical protein